MAGLDDSERSYNVMERLLFYTLPVLFTLLLTGVLLTVFGYDVTNELLRAANKIPVVSEVIPDPKPTEEELREAIRQAGQGQSSEGSNDASAQETAGLQASLAAKETEVAALQTQNQQKDEEIAKLKAEVEGLHNQYEQQMINDEQYASNIQELANVYANMSASRAAPVLENLTLQERVLVLKEMNTEAQVKILEKMNPEIAAKTSILMKDVVPVKDVQIAALQERLALSESGTEGSATLTKDEVSRTFARMTPDRAAEVLLEIAKSNEDRVVNILRLMEEGSRATILNSLANLSKEQTAKITAKLG